MNSRDLDQQAQDGQMPVPVEYYEYPGDNHNISNNFNTAMQRSIAFFDKYVKNAASTGGRRSSNRAAGGNMEHSLLAVFAHPDDEAFGTGGTLAQYAAAGDGDDPGVRDAREAGEIAEGVDATPETLGEVRENELRCAAETMGVRELIFLDYCDSGMAGTA